MEASLDLGGVKSLAIEGLRKNKRDIINPTRSEDTIFIG
jgi:hypothetical protein